MMYAIHISGGSFQIVMSEAQEFTGKVVLITGGARNNGRYITGQGMHINSGLYWNS